MCVCERERSRDTCLGCAGCKVRTWEVRKGCGDGKVWNLGKGVKRVCVVVAMVEVEGGRSMKWRESGKVGTFCGVGKR